MNLNKSRFRSQPTDSYLNATLKVATAQTLVPNINFLTNAKRCQVSSSHSAMNKEKNIDRFLFEKLFGPRKI